MNRELMPSEEEEDVCNQYNQLLDQRKETHLFSSLRDSFSVEVLRMERLPWSDSSWNGRFVHRLLPLNHLLSEYISSLRFSHIHPTCSHCVREPAIHSFTVHNTTSNSLALRVAYTNNECEPSFPCSDAAITTRLETPSSR